MLKEHCTVSDLPDSLTIDVANIEARFNVVYKETKKERESLFVLQEMENVIRENQADNTGVLISTTKCNVCCIFKRRNMGRTCYAVFGRDNKEPKGYDYQIVENVTSAIELLVKMLKDKATLEAKTYEMQFIKCSCDVSEKDRQKIIRRHMSIKQKQNFAKERRENYAAMEPAKKRVCLDNYAVKYANMEPCQKNALSIRQAEKYRLMEPSIKREYRLMEPSKKQELNVKKAEKYRLMEPSRKQELNVKKSEKYRLMEPSKKRELFVQNAEKYRQMEPSKKQELLLQNAEKYRQMEPSKKQELFLQNAEKYRLMEPSKKQELFLQNAEKYRLMDSDKKKDLIKRIVTKGKESKQKKCSSTHSLDYYIEQFKRDIREGPYYICVGCY